MLRCPSSSISTYGFEIKHRKRRQCGGKHLKWTLWITRTDIPTVSRGSSSLLRLRASRRTAAPCCSQDSGTKELITGATFQAVPVSAYWRGGSPEEKLQISCWLLAASFAFYAISQIPNNAVSRIVLPFVQFVGLWARFLVMRVLKILQRAARPLQPYVAIFSERIQKTEAFQRLYKKCQTLSEIASVKIKIVRTFGHAIWEKVSVSLSKIGAAAQFWRAPQHYHPDSIRSVLMDSKESLEDKEAQRLRQDVERLKAEVTEEIRKRDLHGQSQENSHGGTSEEETSQDLSKKSFFVDVKEPESTEKG